MLSFVTLASVLMSFTSAQIPSNRLLNAYNAPLSALTSPNTFYFLEFPVPGTPGGPSWSYNEDTTTPMCGNGTPYSFAFRRGTDEHMSKLIVEFEGGPACWSDESSNSDVGCSCEGKRETPWNGYLQSLKQYDFLASSSVYFPILGSCTGVPNGVVQRAAPFLLNGGSDVPIALRKGIDGSKNGEINMSKEWWEMLSGEHSDVKDWSYILLPHCTLDWHLGRQTTIKSTGCGDMVLHRGGINVQAVMDWITTQFSAIGGLDALVSVSGGKIGGCHTSSSYASLSFAKDIAATGIMKNPSSAIAIMDGGSFWQHDRPSTVDLISRFNADISPTSSLLDSAVSDAVKSSSQVQIAWIASSKYLDTAGVTEEQKWIADVKRIVPNSFHVYYPSSATEKNSQLFTSSACPVYAFEDDSNDKGFAAFITEVVNRMSWSSDSSNYVSQSNLESSSRHRLSFFAIVIILFSIFMLVWIVYFLLKRHRLQKNQPVPPSPSDLWFSSLTRYPGLFLFFSVLLPTILSVVAFASSGYTLRVNLDFESYLNIDTKQERTAQQYSNLVRRQVTSLKEEQENCALLYSSINDYGSIVSVNRSTKRTLKEELIDFFQEQSIQTQNEAVPNIRRDLQNGLYGSTKGKQVITFFYQNRNGGSVFTPAVLKSIKDFEDSIMDFPGFGNYCFGYDMCFPFDSLVPYFFPDGENLVDDIDHVLRGFSVSEDAVSKLDQLFSESLTSDVMTTTVWLKDGVELSAMSPFLETLYRDLLWKVDQERPYKYPDMVFTWKHSYLNKLEADDALNNDALWSLASLCFIGLMVFFKVGNLFVALSSCLCLVLAFTSALYWCTYHFNFNELTMMHVAGLFVMLGIGADDIFLTIDTFNHTKVDCAEICSERNEEEGDSPTDVIDEFHNKSFNDPKIIRKRMISSYKTAGSMMLVSSLTTAICFFSNCFGVLEAINDFGSYMGMVVLLNYVHVMTILPSSILVNELYILPFRKKVWQIIWTTSTGESDDAGLTHKENGNSSSDSETGLVLPSLEAAGAEQSSETVPHSDQDIYDVHSASIISDETFRENEGRDRRDYEFLNHMADMTRLDRLLVKGHAPLVYKRRILFLLIPTIASVILGALAVTNFNVYDGTIIVFKERYNLGRMQKIVDRYFNSELVKTFEEKGFDLEDLVGSLGDSPVSIGDIDSVGALDSIGDKIGDSIIDGDPSSNIENSSDSPSSSSLSDSSSTTPSQEVLTESSSNIESSNESPTSPPSPAFSQSQNKEDLSEELSVVESGDQIPSSPPITSDGEPITSIGEASQSEVDLSAEPPATESGDQVPSSPSIESEVEVSQNGEDFSDESFIMENSNTSPSGRPVSTENNAASFTANEEKLNDGDDSSSNTGLSDQEVGTAEVGTAEVGTTEVESTATSTTSTTSNPQPANLDCPNGMGGLFCLSSSKSEPVINQKEYFVVSLVWGMKPNEPNSNVWLVENDQEGEESELYGEIREDVNKIDPSEPHIQELLLRIITLARDDVSLRVHDEETWIESLRDFAIKSGIGFPVPKDMFIGCLQLMKSQSGYFRALIKKEIGTSSPGIAGDFLYTSISVLSEVPLGEDGWNKKTLAKWSNFTDYVNAILPPDLPPIEIQSNIFTDVHRSKATVDSTVTTYFVANGLCVLIILFFTQNILLTLMIMVSLLMIFMCLGGLLFNVFLLEFGPVEALGVSIFIGLSANYSLHVAHAYHRSAIYERKEKIQRTAFITGSPILASSLSTIGGSAFLFACRSWLLTELGILICAIIALSLLFSMTFFLAWLAVSGPLPRQAENKDSIVHSWDLKHLFFLIPWNTLICRHKAGDSNATPNASEENVSSARCPIFS